MKTVFYFVVILLFTAANVCSQQPYAKMKMVQAVICESIDNFKPVNPARSALYATKWHFFNAVLDLCKVHHKFIGPKRRTFADSRKLSWLVMRKPKCRH